MSGLGALLVVTVFVDALTGTGLDGTFLIAPDEEVTADVLLEGIGNRLAMTVPEDVNGLLRFFASDDVPEGTFLAPPANLNTSGFLLGTTGNRLAITKPDEDVGCSPLFFTSDAVFTFLTLATPFAVTTAGNRLVTSVPIEAVSDFTVLVFLETGG